MLPTNIWILWNSPYFLYIQRAKQLSHTLKKIAASKKFTNFDLFYVDFDFQEGKFFLENLLTQDKSSHYSLEPDLAKRLQANVQ